MESKLKLTFESLDHVSSTADIWSTNNKSYFGMTVHWIDSISFQREKAALACKRVIGRHDVIACEIDQRGIPSTKLSSKPVLFRLAGLLSARVAFHERDLREFPLSNHGNLSDQTNLVGSRHSVRLT